MFEEEEDQGSFEVHGELPPSSPDVAPIHTTKFLEEDEYRRIFEAKCRDTRVPVSEKLFRRFVRYQNRKSLTKIFEMNDCGIGEAACAEIIGILRHRLHFRILSLAGNLIGNNGVVWVAEFLIRRASLIALDLSTNAISDFGATALFRALHANKTVFSLNLSSVSGVARNSLGHESILELSSMLLENHVLSELNIAMTEIAPASTDVLAAGFVGNTTLHVLNVSNNNLRSKGVIAIVKNLHKSQIRELSFSGTHLNDDVAPHFESFLARNTTIEIIDISGNNLTNKFCAAIAGPLATCPSLRELNLSRNPIGGRGIWVLGPPLRAREKNFAVLNVRGCQIEPQGFREFCREIATNITLERLFLSHNPLQDIGGVYLGEVLENHPTLKELDLEMTEISDKSAQAIFQAIAKSPRMAKINVRNNLIHDGIIIHEAACANRRLRSCEVELNAIDYKVAFEINRAVSLNARTWKAGQRKRVAQQLRSAKGTHAQLREVRESLSQARETIAALLEAKQAATDECAKARESKYTKISQLEARLEELSEESSKFAYDNQSASDETRSLFEKKESEVNGMSGRLSRETETLSKETKALAVLEQRIVQARSNYKGELSDLSVALEHAKNRYDEFKRGLIDAWKTAQILEQARLDEEEAAANGGDGGAPAPAGVKKGKKKKEKKEKKETGGKSKSKEKGAK
jgi:Ran GTPase-activating protein (RanGAP) involved in mRNA processing and transport